MQSVPSVSILAGWAVIDVFGFCRSRNIITSKKMQAVFAALLVLLMMMPVGLDSVYYAFDSPQRNMMKIQGESPFVESPYVGRYLRERTSPEDRLIIFGSEMQIYYYAKRLSASKYIAVYPLMYEMKDSPRRQEEMKEDLLETKPAYALYINTGYSWDATEKAKEFIEWVGAYIRDNYELDGATYMDDSSGTQEIVCALGESVKALSSERIDTSRVLVFKRKGKE